MSQKKYDDWVTNVPCEEHDRLNLSLFPNEEYFIDSYAKNSILDIGCGTGHRTFPYFEEKRIYYLGVEKFPHLIECSSYQDKILQADFAGDDFVELPALQNKNFDLCALFGGVSNGLIDNNIRQNAWKNIGILADSICNYILLDTLNHFNWFETAEKGQTLKLLNFLPPQYFYSKKEIENLISTNNLTIVETMEEPVGTYRRIHYLLKKNI